MSTSTFLRTHRASLVRVALLPVIWGLVLSSWFSLGKTLLDQQMPDLKAAVAQAANNYSHRLSSLQSQLATLASDPRITGAATPAEALNQRRALYEFGYLNQHGAAYVLTPDGQELGRPAGAPALPLQASDLQQVMATGQDIRPLDHALLLLRKHQKSPVVVALRLPLADLDLLHEPGETPTDDATPADQTEPADEQKKSADLHLLFNTASQWQEIMPSHGGIKTTSKPDLGLIGLGGMLHSEITVATPVPEWPGWWVNRVASVRELNHLVFLLQLGLLVLGAGASGGLWLVPAHLFDRQAAGRKRSSPTGGMGSIGGGGSGRGGIGASGGDFSGGISGNGKAPSPAALALRTNALVQDRAKAKAAEPPTRETPQQILQHYEVQKQREAIHHNDMLHKLRRALQNRPGEETLRGFYQPIYRSSDGLPVMHEVLVRLQEPNGDMLLPGEFIHVAKQHDLLPQLDAAMLRLMLAEHFRLGQQPAGKLALNISSTTFAGLTYMREMMEQIPPTMVNSLVFEVRSRELLADPSAMGFLRELKDMGAQLTVDYFGGGRQMLESSKQLGFDFLKIDAALLWANMDKRRELMGLAKIARSLDLPMILEKVESQVVEVFARRVGIPYLQGYHFAKPEATMVTTRLPGWREAAQQTSGANVPV